jgi:flagellar basal-body rod protein FlgC
MALGALNALTIAADGMSAQRLKMDTVAENIAHAETTRTPEGGPYRRQRVLMTAPAGSKSFGSELRSARLTLRRSREGHRLASARPVQGPTGTNSYVNAKAVSEGPEDFRMIYDPSHPDADDQGFVAMPNVEIMTEMVELMSAQRAYEANLMSVEAIKSMVKQALDI